jgi:GDP-L-fucose synthase
LPPVALPEGLILSDGDTLELQLVAPDGTLRVWRQPFFPLNDTNLYGPGDNFDLANSHVLPALIRKTAEAKASGAKQVVVWGTGTPRREFLYSDDLGQACCFLMNLDGARFGSLLNEDAPPLINIGTGEDVTIRELAETVARVLGFDGALVFNTTKPDGTPQKLLDVSLLHSLGWRHTTSLEEGLRRTWEAVRDQLT